MIKNKPNNNCRGTRDLLYGLQSKQSKEVITTETRLATTHTFVHKEILFGKDDYTKRINTLARNIVEILAPNLLKEDTWRSLSRPNLTKNEKGCTGYTLFESEEKDGGILLSSERLGIEVHVISTGKNLSFGVHSCRGYTKTCEMVEKTLENRGYWTRRIAKISLLTKGSCFEYGMRDKILDCHVYPFHPVSIVKSMLNDVPKSKTYGINPNEVLKSFLSMDNYGVKVCEVFGSPIYMRFIPEHKPRGDIELSWRQSQGIRIEGMAILSRSPHILVEFLIRSCAKNYDTGNDQRIDYYKEQKLMKRAARILNLGLGHYHENIKES